MTNLKGEVTKLLEEVHNGSDQARDRLFSVVYDELMRLAKMHTRRASNQLTLNPRTLLHEAYLKVGHTRIGDLASSRHFYNLMSAAMRQVVVDLIRKRAAPKHGGGSNPSTLTDAIPGHAMSLDDILAIDEALKSLERIDPELAQVFQWSFFGGMEVGEIAAALEVTERTVRRRFAAARAMIASFLK